jgi:hypothetical protein
MVGRGVAGDGRIGAQSGFAIGVAHSRSIRISVSVDDKPTQRHRHPSSISRRARNCDSRGQDVLDRSRERSHKTNSASSSVEHLQRPWTGPLDPGSSKLQLFQESLPPHPLRTDPSRPHAWHREPDGDATDGQEGPRYQAIRSIREVQHAAVQRLRSRAHRPRRLARQTGAGACASRLLGSGLVPSQACRPTGRA